MRNQTVGTRSWVEAADATLRLRDRVAILGQAAIAFAALPAETLGRSGLIAGKKRVHPRATPSEETDATTKADARCSELAPKFLRSHSHRTYVWARILATLDGIPDHLVDDELLYVACLVHDLGLSTTQESPVIPPCFTLTGARAFREIASAEAWDEDRIRRGEEAITLHMNPRVPTRQGIEAHLLSRASRLDAVGIGKWKVHKADEKEVFAAFPRDPDRKDGFSELFDICRHAPRSRARMYWYFGSKWWFRLGP